MMVVMMISPMTIPHGVIVMLVPAFVKVVMAVPVVVVGPMFMVTIVAVIFARRSGWHHCGKYENESRSEGERLEIHVMCRVRRSARLPIQIHVLFFQRAPPRPMLKSSDFREFRHGAPDRMPRECPSEKRIVAHTPDRSVRFATVTVPPCNSTASRTKHKPRPELLRPVSGRFSE